jgi:hypothetical protein
MTDDDKYDIKINKEEIKKDKKGNLKFPPDVDYEEAYPLFD